MKKKNKKKGFTLIELIAVIAILAILAAVLIPNIFGQISKSKITAVKNNAKVLANVIQTAQASQDDATIDTYDAATTKDSNVAVSQTINATLKSLDLSTLNKIINDPEKTDTSQIAGASGHKWSDLSN